MSPRRGGTRPTLSVRFHFAPDHVHGDLAQFKTYAFPHDLDAPAQDRRTLTECWEEGRGHGAVAWGDEGERAGFRGVRILRSKGSMRSARAVQDPERGYAAQTLALLMLELKRWISAYGFFGSTKRLMLGTATLSTGGTMGLKRGSRTSAETIEEMEKCVEGKVVDIPRQKFEETDLKYAETNRRVAEYTVDLLLKPHPSFLHPLCYQIVMAVLEPKMRSAFGWFLLPRVMNLRHTSPGKDKNGMYRTLWSPGKGSRSWGWLRLLK
ncbi:hypothetical protein BJ742DRAFT_765848 [Cladochytrium replicatum]|nr:hypothetical protein BJ742DRAFT_765848 [Cladochytrium replicatum]